MVKLFFYWFILTRNTLAYSDEMSNVNCRGSGIGKAPVETGIHFLAEFLLRVRLATSHTHISSSWQPRLLRSSFCAYQCSPTPFFGPHSRGLRHRPNEASLTSHLGPWRARPASLGRSMPLAGRNSGMLRFPRHTGEGEHTRSSRRSKRPPPRSESRAHSPVWGSSTTGE